MSSVERLQRSRLGCWTSSARAARRGSTARRNLTIAGEHGPLVFKEYREQAHLDQRARRHDDFRQRLSDHDRAVLDVLANWPLRVVEGDAGAAEGVVIPLIATSSSTSCAVPTARANGCPRDGQYLAQPKERCERVGIPLVGLGDRYRFCRDLAFAIGFLHKRDVCIGDISFANIAYSLKVHPCVYLVDCDAFRLKGTPRSCPQLHTPDWVPPEGPKVQSDQTDLYKLGLFILRALSPRALSGQNRDPSWADGVLDPRGRYLLRKALSRRTGAPRTSAKEWCTYFHKMLALPGIKTTAHTSRMPGGAPMRISA